jgi:hypothetical protein
VILTLRLLYSSTDPGGYSLEYGLNKAGVDIKIDMFELQFAELIENL